MHKNVPKVVGIVGSRTYPDLERVAAFVRGLPPGTVVVSGGARGVDSAAKAAAEKNDLPYKPFHIENFEWGLAQKHEVAYFRNEQLVAWIAKYGGVLVAFTATDAKGEITGGTANAIAHARRLGVRVMMIGV